MSLVSLNRAIAWPGHGLSGATTPGLAGLATLDAAGEYTCVIMCAREAMTISHVGFRAQTATGSPTADVRIETVGTDGLPSGTLWATDTNLVTGAISAGWNLYALTASASIAAGQLFAVKILYNSGTSVVPAFAQSLHTATGLPYRVVNTGTPTKAATSGEVLALGSSATTFYELRNCLPLSSMANNTFDNTDSAARGNRFQVPMRCRCVGISWWASTAIGGFNAVLYNDAGTELSSSSTAFDGDQLSNIGTGGASEVFFDNPVTLEPGTWYRAALEPTAAVVIALSVFTLPSADYRSGMYGGTNFHYTTRASGVWTDSGTNQVALLDILIDQFDKGLTNPSGNMSGGLQ